MQFKNVPLSMLSEGFVLASAVRDTEQRLLLGAGVSITQDLVRGLYRRGIRNVVVAEDDWERLAAFSSQGKARKVRPHRGSIRPSLECESIRQLDAVLGEIETFELTSSSDPFLTLPTSKEAVRYDRAKMDEIIAHQQRSVDQVKGLFGQLRDGRTIAAEAVNKISRDYLIRAAEDIDLFVCMGINPIRHDAVFSHSANVATLAVAIGAVMGLDEKSLCDLGTGCLVHDAGMMHINRNLYESDRVLDSSDFVEIAKHPIISTDLLYKQMEQVPNAVRMIAYQMHERCDGSGYPKGATAARIHPLAKIAAVADSYVALVSHRPYRPAMLPYFAMAKMLEDVAAGLFDPAVVRGLLHAVSLFPIGSFVELNNGQVAKAIRAGGEAYDRPVVEAWNRGRLSDSPSVVDLAKFPELRVVKALASLD